MTKQARKVIVDAMLMTKCLMDTNVPYAQVLEEQWTRGGLSGVTRYTYGDALLAHTTSGISHFYQYDGLSSTRALTDAAGAVIDTYAGACPERSRRDAYGQLLEQTGASTNAYLYRGEQYDPETDAYYLRARYYQPGSGRFLTTDPVEGIMTNPMSLHRYMYGNDNPISYVDPSGNLTLNESLIVATEISLMAMLTFSECEEAGFGIYSGLAKHVFPDAFVIGLNFTYLSFDLLSLVDLFFNNSFFPAPHPFPISYNMNVGVGRELLLSVSSGEAVWYKTDYVGYELRVGTGLTYASLGFELYDGAVFNLWNSYDYLGPFESMSLGIGNNYSGSIFWDAKRKFNGPWGASRTAYSKNFSPLQPWKTNQWMSRGDATINYTFLDGKPDQSGSRSDIVIAIGTLTLIEKVMVGILKAKEGDLSPLAWWLFETSFWANTAVAHHYWDVKEPQYDMYKRRESKEKRPEGFHSGPSYWRSWL